MKYQKRIQWDRHRPEFLKIGFIFALAIALMAFNYTSELPEFEVMEIEPLEEDILLVPPPTIHKKKVLPPPPPPKITVVAEIEPVDEPEVTFEKETEIIENVKTEVDEFANNPVPEPAPIVEIEIESEPEDDTVLIMAERMPIYGDCSIDGEEVERRDCTSQNLINHIYSNVKYPALARENNAQGTVVVSFIVNKNGDAESIEILRDIGFGCGDEVNRVIKKLGKFLPGKQNGRPVSVIYRLPVKFSLQ